ncbi:hypothetical protein MMC07_000440 [Pseudocyphellaria aurata]|nr:hypothetical protein [Pseudocyphellaria aurata]
MQEEKNVTLQCSASSATGQSIGRGIDPNLDKEGSHDVLGVDDSWNTQVLDAVLVKDGSASLEPGDVLGAIKELRHDAACTEAGAQ